MNLQIPDAFQQLALSRADGALATVRLRPERNGRFYYTAQAARDGVCAGSEASIQAALNAACREIEART